MVGFSCYWGKWDRRPDKSGELNLQTRTSAFLKKSCFPTRGKIFWPPPSPQVFQNCSPFDFVVAAGITKHILLSNVTLRLLNISCSTFEALRCFFWYAAPSACHVCVLPARFPLALASHCSRVHCSMLVQLVSGCFFKQSPSGYCWWLAAGSSRQLLLTGDHLNLWSSTDWPESVNDSSDVQRVATELRYS